MILYLTNAFGNSLGWPRVADPVIEASQLTQLQRLHLNSNQLTALPESISQLTQLQDLLLHRNENLGIPGDYSKDAGLFSSCPRLM